MHVEECQLKTPTPSVCNGVFVTRRPGLCVYDQIFLAGESGSKPKKSGVRRRPPTCQGEGESPNPGNTEYKCLGSVEHV